jgi:hypothetical protein
MTPHAAIQVWREPPPVKASPKERSAGINSGAIRFQNINEAGQLARGRIELAAPDSLLWHWDATARDGALTRYKVRMSFDQPGTYRFTVALLKEPNAEQPLVDVRFKRVDQAPEAFLKVAN